MLFEFLKVEENTIDKADVEQRIAFEQAVARLPIKERKVIYYIIEGYTQEEVGLILFPYISRTSVWQIRKSAIEKIKRIILHDD